MWNIIKNNKDLNRFLEQMSHFHDSCIKEMRYISGAYVDTSLSMYPVNNKRVLDVIVQRQQETLSTIEMQFIGLKYLHLRPVDEDYTCEISDATMLFRDGYIYWCEDYSPAVALEAHAGTVICASVVRWRQMNDVLGEEGIYRSR